MSIQRAKHQIIQKPDSDAYWFLSDMFTKLTNIKHEVSHRCCTSVDRYGAPKCCYRITQGIDDPTFTDIEMRAIMDSGESLPAAGMFPIYDSLTEMWTAKVRDPAVARESLYNGLLSRVIECASHPTRPIIKYGKVVGVAVVTDCIAEYALHELEERGERFFHLWEVTVQKFGIKPYYISSTSVPAGKFKAIYGELPPEIELFGELEAPPIHCSDDCPGSDECNRHD